MEIYVVKQGDTVESIAADFSVDAETLAADNQILYPYRLAVGQALLIPSGLGNRNAVLRSSGYAYPFIDVDVLNKTLPFLSSMNVFSYGFTKEGKLVPPAYDDSWMIVPALEQGVVSVLTLTPLTAAGNFDNNLISEIVRNRDAQRVLFENLADTMLEKGYIGVNLDFEYVKAEDREYYTEFVRNCTERLHEQGYQVSVALSPKTSDNQVGELYEGIDYEALGEIADTVVLMTYEWGYTYGPPMAVAPLDKVREVMEYAASRISPAKIMMGIPNYGYDWQLPYVAGETQAESIGNVEAVQRAIENNAEIQFDETAKSPYFYYVRNGIQHVVWFEDVRSLQAKFDLIKEFGIRGATYWQLMQWFRANWLLMEDNFFVLPGL